MTSSRGSALIPFCAFKTNLNFSGKAPTLDGANFPLCSSFLPTILEGQLCYKLTLNKTSGKGKKNELMMLLDYNEDRSLQALPNMTKDASFSNRTLDFDTAARSIKHSSSKIQINTLSPYVGFGGGSYRMSVVKRMTAKEDFLEMPFSDRNCEVEIYEDCRTRKLLKECNCVPWETSDSSTFQVQIMNKVNCQLHFQLGNGYM